MENTLKGHTEVFGIDGTVEQILDTAIDSLIQLRLIVVANDEIRPERRVTAVLVLQDLIEDVRRVNERARNKMTQFDV